MEELIAQLLEEELRPVRGAKVEGKLYLKDQAINEIMQAFLESTRREAPPTPEAAGTGPDFGRLLRHARVEELSFSSEAGRSALFLKVSLEE